MRRAILIVCIAFGLAPRAHGANAMNDFVVSCSYGVLAGTLVGAASLAFSDRPGDNLNRIARGASLGLYAGILLGLYVVYGTPSPEEEAAAAAGVSSFKPVPQYLLVPVENQGSIDGAYITARVLSF